MKRISSTSTAFYKMGVPVLGGGFLGVFVVLAVMHGAPIFFLLMPCLMGVLGYFVLRRVVWDLVDEVYDAGDYLVVKTHGREHRLSLSDITNVSSTMAMNPPRITLKLAGHSSGGALGAEVVFSPERSFTLNPFVKSEIAEDLIVRVDKARSRRAV